MRLGIGELNLRKNGLVPEMHFASKVILPRTHRTLVPSITIDSRVLYYLWHNTEDSRKCQFKPSTSKMNAIQQPNSFDQQTGAAA